MNKLWRRWIGLLLFVVAISALFVRLGEWQLHRLAWRRGNNAVVEKYQKQPVRPYQEVMGPGRTIGDADQWQRVTLTGTYDATHQVQAMLRNTLDASAKAGSEVLTPMHTTRGDWVLVDRGFLVRADGAGPVAVMPAPPSGQVTVVGYLRRDERGNSDATLPVNNAVRLISAPQVATVLPYPLLDGYVGLVSSTPAQAGDLLPMTTPELTEGPHLSYAIQWFCFTGIAALGAGILIRGDLRERRKRAAKAARAQARMEKAAEPVHEPSTGSPTSDRLAGEAPVPEPAQPTAGATAAPLPHAAAGDVAHGPDVDDQED